MSGASVPLLAVLLLVGCSSGTAPYGAAGPLEARAVAGTLTVTNVGTQPVSTFAVGRSLTDLLNSVRCRGDSTDCPQIAPGATLRIAYPGGAIPAGEREAVVHWWSVQRVPGRDLELERSGSLIVPLE